MEERRRGNRISLESHLVIKRIDESEGEEVAIDILDVSRSGIGFSCKIPLEIGAVYESFLTIWTQETIHAFLQITRIEMLDERFEYGAFFIGMSETDSLRIDVYDTVEKEIKKQHNKEQ